MLHESRQGLKGRRDATSRCRCYEKQRNAVCLSRTSRSDGRVAENGAFEGMLLYSKSTVSPRDDYRLGCVVKCIKPHKMEILASLDVSSPPHGATPLRIQGAQEREIEMVWIPCEGVWRQSGWCLPFIRVDFLWMPRQPHKDDSILRWELGGCELNSSGTSL